jgi:DNA-binding GntR family transcriptional regulator
MTIDPDDGEAIWKQVARILRDQIAAGNPPRRRRLPAIRDLAHEFGVSEGTVKHALAQLREEGIIATENGRGSYVL